MSARIGVIYSNLCCNENKPLQRVMASEASDCISSPPFWHAACHELSFMSVRTYRYWSSTGGFTKLWVRVWLQRSCRIPTPSCEFMLQTIFMSLELCFRAAGITTPTQTSDVHQWGLIKKTHGCTHGYSTCGWLHGMCGPPWFSSSSHR